jgi:disulfide bond formation protein DsbB
MFTVMTVLGIAGWMKSSSKGIMTAALIVSLAGTLFSGTLSVLELWFRTPRPTTLPACVYGGFIYLALLIVAWFGWRAMGKALAPSLPTAPQA